MHSWSCRCKLHPSANQAGTGTVLKSGPKISVMADLLCGGEGAASDSAVTADGMGSVEVDGLKWLISEFTEHCNNINML